MRTEYDRLDRSCGVDTSSVKLAISSRMTSKFGCFTVKKKTALAKPELSITIAARTLADEAVFWDVIRHEYAHAVVHLRDPRHNHAHDAVWKAVCREVGCIPKATRRETAATSSATGTGKRVQRPYKYEIICSTCGAVSRYKTESKVVKVASGEWPGVIFCRRCGSRKFTVRKLK